MGEQYRFSGNFCSTKSSNYLSILQIRELESNFSTNKFDKNLVLKPYTDLISVIYQILVNLDAYLCEITEYTPDVFSTYSTTECLAGCCCGNEC